MKVKRNKKSLTEATLDDVVSKAENDLAQGNDNVEVADVSVISPSISREVMRPDAMILVF